MAKKPLEVLSESMFYLLMALDRAERCGMEIAAFIDRKTGGRVAMGPGTLYALLGRFLEEGLIQETEGAPGRRRSYRLTERGRRMYGQELERLRQCVADAESEARALPAGEEASHEAENPVALSVPGGPGPAPDLAGG